MQTSQSSLWPARIITLTLALLATGSATYWALKIGQDAGALPPAVAEAPIVLVDADPKALARVFGAGQDQTAPPPALASRFALVGVLAGHRYGGGAALVSVDGKPATIYRVGAPVEGGLILQSLQARQAVLATDMQSPDNLIISLPEQANAKGIGSRGKQTAGEATAASSASAMPPATAPAAPAPNAIPWATLQKNIKIPQFMK